MAIEPKVRPTLSLRDLAIIANALESKIIASIGEGNVRSPLLLDLVRIKAYCESFQPKANDAEALLAAYLKKAAGAGAGGTDTDAVIDPIALAQANQEVSQTTLATSIDDVIAKASVSPIDNPDLTDDQRYDLLSMLSDKQRTSEENAWYLEKGFTIKLKRAGLANNSVNGGDL